MTDETDRRSPSLGAVLMPLFLYMNHPNTNKFLLLLCAGIFSACASTAPAKIGADTYFASKTNTAGIFGDVSAVTGALIVEGNQFCGTMNKEFELVTQSVTQNIPGVRFGGASITFKCVDHARSPVMRPDNGVSSVTTK